MSSNSPSNSTTRLVVAAVAVAAAAAAGYYFLASPVSATHSSSSDAKTQESSSSSSSTSSPAKTSPKKKKKKKKKKAAAAAAAAAAATSSDNTTTKTAATKTTPSSPSAAAAPPTSASDVILGITRNAEGLQTAGTVSEEVILDFFNRSNALLAKQSTKDFLAAAHKNGESISEVLKGKQEAVWAELGVEAQFGFTTIQRTLNNPETMTEKLRGALLQAAAAEDGILTYALVGSQEKFEAEQERLKRLTEEAQKEVQTEMAPLYQGQDEKALQSYYNKIQEDFSSATKDFEGQDEIGRLKMRQNLTDQQYKAIVKGQMLQQIMAYQQQAAMAQMQGRARTR